MKAKTVIVTGASHGIGAGLVKAFLGRGYNVMANSRNISKSGTFEISDKLALVDGRIAEEATSKFGSIDALGNNAGIFFAKSFTDYTIEDLRSLSSVNIEGFLFISQLAIKQMLVQKTGGSIVNISTTMADHPIAGINCAVAMITKGGLEAVTRSLAMEYAKEISEVKDIVDAIVYLTEAHQVTGEVLHVDGGAHVGKW